MVLNEVIVKLRKLENNSVKKKIIVNLNQVAACLM